MSGKVKQKIDNRMSWIRHLQELGSKKKKTYYYQEFELASECRITGFLDYKKGSIQCSFLSSEKDKNGLHRYFLRVKSYFHLYRDDEDAADLPDFNTPRKGYYFKGGIAEELISILSLYFQCRFYIVAENSIRVGGVRHRTEKDLIYRKVPEEVHPTVLAEKSRSLNNGLSDFLDEVISIPVKFQQDFMWATFQYAQSLRQIGIDTEMVFIRLVSGIEILGKHIEIDPGVDVFSGKSLSDLIDVKKLPDDKRKELEEIFSVRKSKLKFISFVEKYCTGFFKGGICKAEHCKIRRKGLIPRLKAIYDARSAYLHRGESMYLSTPLRMKEARKWDTDPSMGMIIDNRSFSGSQKLPFAHFFESLVRHCLLNFLKDKCSK